MSKVYDWYQTLKPRAYFKDLESILRSAPRGLPPNIGAKNENIKFQGLVKIQTLITDINQNVFQLVEIHNRLQPLPEGEDRNNEILRASKDMASIRDELRNHILAINKALRSPHAQPFFGDDIQRKDLIKKTNALQTALNRRLFEENRRNRYMGTKIPVQDEDWAKEIKENNEAAPTNNKIENSTTIVFSYKLNEGIKIAGSSWFSGWRSVKVAHDDIKLSAKQLCQAVDFMKNANLYIRTWEDNLKKLETDPHNAELKKYEKYKHLLEHLKFCQKYPSPIGQDPNRTKNVTGEDSMKLSLKTKTFCIDCKDPETKEAMLHVLKLHSQIVAEEKKELENEAGFGAELLEANNPELQENAALQEGDAENRGLGL
jgi:hypothetical protein